MPDGERRQYQAHLPQELGDGLAIRADAAGSSNMSSSRALMICDFIQRTPSPVSTACRTRDAGLACSCG